MKVNSVKHILGNGWEIEPAGGLTGEAFFATHNEEKLFLKRNSSPFLAVLSAEGIVPKLIWTKRLENGDVITAQEWVAGRKLEPYEMNGDGVAKLLKKIHRSKPLLSMLRRLGKTPILPENLIADFEKKIPIKLKNENIIRETIDYLNKQLPSLSASELAVCHCDVNHNNWLLTEDDQLYLIDWEGAAISDPALDIGPLLYWYIPEEDWEKWLYHYGMELTDSLKQRLKWFVLYQTLLTIKMYYEKNQEENVRFWVQYLETFF